MIDERKTLKELLTDPLIAKIAPDAIRFMDLSKEDLWEKSLEQLRKECFGGDLAAGFERLFEAARSVNGIIRSTRRRNARRMRTGKARTWCGCLPAWKARTAGRSSSWFRAADLSMSGT